jgi:hypothetical protein
MVTLDFAIQLVGNASAIMPDEKEMFMHVATRQVPNFH